MKKTILTLLICFFASCSFANTLLIEGFEYANHDLGIPVGWQSDNQWLCGFMDKDHNRTAHTGNWYAFTTEDDSWMYMELFMSDQLKFRYSCWAVSDGSFQLEFWGGDAPTPEGMKQRFINATVNSNEYELIEEYVENLSQDYQYIGIHAIATEGAYHLTIDDIIVDMVDRYDMIVDPYEIDTVMYPGSTITFNYQVHNTGYEAMHIYMNAINSDYFSNIQFTEDGFNYSSFPTEPDQVVQCSCTATLSPNIKPGNRVWLDIMFTVTCDCITRMATIWVDVIDATSTDEQTVKVEAFPNPATDYVNISAKGLSELKVMDIMGRTLSTVQVDADLYPLILSELKPGIYFIAITSDEGETTKKLVKQ